MPFERRPRRLVPRGMLVPNSVPHRVQDGESWETLAEKYGVAADQIIYANFWTLAPEEVNWYLRHHVGCIKPTRDGKNWMFSSKAKPGIIQIPPQVFTFDEPEIITGTPPPRYYAVTVDPSTWTAPAGMVDGGVSANGVVSRTPWEHKTLTIGSLTIKGRQGWGASEPTWKNEVIYYNIAAYPLTSMLKAVIVHHTDNEDSIKEVESTQKGKGYAAIGYHFFIDQKGTIHEGRPLEIMGSNAGEGTVSGPTNDPDWGAIGITLQGDYHNADNWVFSDDAPKAQLQSLEDLVVALRKDYPIDKLLMHREVTRGGKPTVCPGDAMVPHVKSLRTKLGLSGP